MGRVKDWLIDMNEHIVDAIESCATTDEDVISYCKTHMELPVDNNYVKQTIKKYKGEKDEH